MPNQPHVVKFVVFEVDLTAGEVRKAGMEQKLAGQLWSAKIPSGRTLG